MFNCPACNHYLNYKLPLHFCKKEKGLEISLYFSKEDKLTLTHIFLYKGNVKIMSEFDGKSTNIYYNRYDLMHTSDFKVDFRSTLNEVYDALQVVNFYV